MALGRPARVALVAAVVVVGLGAGLLVADLTSPADEDLATPATTTPGTSRPTAPPGGTASSSTPPSSRPSTSTSTTSSTTPTSSTTSSALPSSTVATTLPPPTAPPTTLPPLISVSYLQDASGALPITAGGTGTITLLNSGGSAGQWLLSPAGGDLALSTSQGTLAPGEQVTIVVTDLVGEPRQTALSGFVAPSRRVTVAVTVTK